MFLEFALLATLAQAPASCPATPRQPRLSVIAPMAGLDPVWVVAPDVWLGDTSPIKTAWVLSRRVSGALTVSGRRLDGSGHLTFRRGLTGPIVDTLTIADPAAGSMVPGGATAEMMRDYAFVSSYVFYPSRGCWELQMQFGDHDRRVMIEVK